MERKNNERDSAMTVVAIGAGITLTGIFIGGALQYIYHILLARYLGPDALGIFILGITIVTIASSFSRLGFDLGILRYVAMYSGTGDRERVKSTVVEAIKLASIASIIISILLFIFSSHISKGIFHRQELIPILKVLSFTVFFSALMMIFLVTCQALYVARYTALVKNLVYPLLTILLALIVLLLGGEGLSVSVTFLISTIIAFILSGYFLLKLFPEIKEGTHVGTGCGELFKYSLPLLGSSFLSYLILWTDTLMIGFLKDSHAVGLYSAAAKSSMLLIFILQSFNTLFSPQISDLYNKNEMVQLEKMFKTVARWAITIGFPAFIFMVFWAEDILNIFGKIFIDAYLPLIILAIGQFFNVSMGSVGSMLVMIGRNRIVLLYSFLVFGLNLFLNYILIPKYGISGAAIATASSFTILNLLYLMTVYYILKIHPYEMAVIKPVIGGAFAIGISLTLIHIMAVGWKWELMISLITIMTSYILILVLLRFDKNDKIIFKDLKERLVNKVIITANNKQ